MEPNLAAMREHRIEFTGTGKEYFGIWIVNILLTILTLGVYSAWAKVRNRKYFYNNTWLDGSPFDYLASPVAILKGWLIAAAVFIVYTLTADFAPAISLIILAFIILVTPWVVVRAMRFNLINTAYRNVRFSFRKNYQDSNKVFLGWMFVSMLTLGMAFPYYYYRQKKFALDNASFSQDCFSLDAIGREFYLLFFKALGVTVLFFIVLFGSFFGIGFGVGLSDIGSDTIGATAGVITNILVYLFIIFMVAYFNVRVNNLIWNNVSLGQHRFRSVMRVWPMFIIYFTNLLAIVFTLGLMIPWAKVRTARYRLHHTSMLTAHNLDAYVTERMQEQNALGDQLGEAFDIEIGL
ncbi:MAG: DUF898 domain-containing protein [Gammaproteobacteria bacterium]|nr:DUF898 domain-containing protein [Gammaproteobacteria bacterium]